MSRDGAPQIKLASESPLIIYISKKCSYGTRAVNEQSALAALKKLYPDIPTDSWILHYTSRSTRATQKAPS